MREQRMIKPCMQCFDKALTYEHVNVRDYNLVHACNSHTYTWTQKRERRPNVCMSENTRNTHGHAQVLNLHVHAHTYSARVS